LESQIIILDWKQACKKAKKAKFSQDVADNEHIRKKALLMGGVPVSVQCAWNPILYNDIIDRGHLVMTPMLEPTLHHLE
jgi:hypothetical protein